MLPLVLEVGWFLAVVLLLLSQVYED